MPDVIGGETRPLPFELLTPVIQNSIVPSEPVPCGLPIFPEDSNEKITVLLRVSLNEFTAISNTIDVGRDIAYGSKSQYIWWLWSVSIMCAAFCEEMAQCFTDENEALIAAVAAAIRNNPQLRLAIADAIQQEGGATPGLPLSDQAAAENSLPENVYDEEGDCILDNLWGGILYLVQTGNRAINDFFEIVESAGNTLETATIVAETIPAAGDYVAAAGAFADQLQENISEGYAAAYTEEYEEQLACAIFCIARENCDLSIDQLIQVLNDRLPSPEDVSDFGMVMARIGSGTYSGPEIADVAFYLYFTALRFGQQFGDTLGIRPLTDMMSLGADFLSSDNWELLCACVWDWEQVYDFTIDAQTWTDLAGGTTNYVSDNGWEHAPSPNVGRLQIKLELASAIDVISARIEYTSPTITGDTQTVTIYKDSGYTIVEVQPYSDNVLFTTDFSTDQLALDTAASVNPNTDPIPGYLYRITLRGTGTPPPAP